MSENYVEKVRNAIAKGKTDQAIALMRIFLEKNQKDDDLLDTLIIQSSNYHITKAEMKGKASYDSTLDYGLLRFAFPFNPIVKENYQPIVDNTTNEKVRYS